MGNCLSTSPVPAPVPAPVPVLVPVPVTAPALATTTLYPYQDVTYDNTPAFTFEGIRRDVKVLRILDGDTVDIAFAHEDTGKVYRHRVRLYGIDTPEKRPSKSDPLRHLEMEASYRAKEALERRLQEHNYIVFAHFSHTDKYGRLLCTFYDKTGENLNKWMVTHGYAIEYFGKTKKKFQASQASQASPISTSL